MAKFEKLNSPKLDEVWDAVYSFVDKRLAEEFEDALAYFVDSAVESYDVDWTDNDASTAAAKSYEKARDRFLVSLTDLLLEDFPQ